MSNKGISIYLNNGHSHTYLLPDDFDYEILKNFEYEEFLRIRFSEGELFLCRTGEIDCIVVGPITRKENA